jgi:predicted dinucleotide-binding enzyme
MQKVGVLGSGNVAQTLAKGFKKHGYDVRIGSRSAGTLAEFSRQTGIPAGTFSETAQWADWAVLAVKGTAAESALQIAGPENLKGKVVIDTTNPIADEPPVDGVLKFFTGPNESLLERLQNAVPEARFVKAFNCVGNAYMVNPSLPGGRPTMFFCGNDPEAKSLVAEVLDKFGWDLADMGSAAGARAIEPLCQLWCIPGFRQNQWSHAFKLLKA